jgi:hypothetical protein
MAERRPPVPVIVLAVAVPLLSLVHAWQGRRAASPPERVFLGFRYMPADHFQYAAFMRQAQDGGGPLMKNPFTSEPQRGVYVLLHYWALGSLSRLTGLDPTAAWELARVAGGAAYILLFWALTAHYFDSRPRRVFATALFALAGGLDWIVVLLRAAGVPGLEPLEYPFESFWNWSAFGTLVFPNWVCAACLVIVACLVLLRRPRGWPFLSFALPPLVWFTHHYTASALYLMLGLLPLVPLAAAAARRERPPWARARANLVLAAPALSSAIVVAGYLLWARTDAVFAANAAGTLGWTLSFGVWWYPLAYGLLLPLAWFGIRSALRAERLPQDLLLAWLAASVLLSVNPIAAGVKYQYLVFAPLVLLAAEGRYRLEEASPRAARRFRSARWAVPAALLLFLNAPACLLKGFRAAGDDGELFRPAAEIEAMEWLSGRPEGVVLSWDRSGRVIPWLSGKTVYLAHWFMTLDIRRKAGDVAAFFAPQAPASLKREVLRRSGARYVYYGPSEAALGAVDPSLPLREVYQNAEVTIYEVGDQ